MQNSRYSVLASLASNEGPNRAEIISLKQKLFDDSFLDEDQSVLGDRLPDDVIKVYLRVKPSLKAEHVHRIVSYDEKSIVVEPPTGSQRFLTQPEAFYFSRVFNSTIKQLDIYEETVKSQVANVLLGKNELIFTYGTTSSGKTHTLLGSSADPGLVPHALHSLFTTLNVTVKARHLPENSCNVAKLTDKQLSVVMADKELLLKNYSRLSKDRTAAQFKPDLGNGTDTGKSEEVVEIWVSFAEIYNENVLDLFDPAIFTGPASAITASARKKTSSLTQLRRAHLDLRTDRSNATYIKGLRWIPVNSVQEAMQLLHVGRHCQQVAATKLNTSSSRSHCIFAVKVVRLPQSMDPRVARLSSLSFCDLAGSERCEKAQTQRRQTRMREAVCINNSLVTFGRCVEILRNNQTLQDRPQWVPYRDSKLTRLFQSFFQGQGAATMIVTASQDADLFDETLHTLRFSAITREVRIQSNLVPNDVKILQDDKENSPHRNEAQSITSMVVHMPKKIVDQTLDESIDEDLMESNELVPYLEKLSRGEIYRLFKQFTDELHQTRGKVARLEGQERQLRAEAVDEAMAKKDEEYRKIIDETHLNYQQLLQSHMETYLQKLNLAEDEQEDARESIATHARRLVKTRKSLAMFCLPDEEECSTCHEYIEEIRRLREQSSELEAELGEQRDLVSKLQFDLDELRFEMHSQSFAMKTSQLMPRATTNNVIGQMPAFDQSRLSFGGDDATAPNTVIRVGKTDFVMATPPVAKPQTGNVFASTPTCTMVKKTEPGKQQQYFSPITSTMSGKSPIIASYHNLVSNLKTQLDTQHEENRMLRSRLVDQAVLLKPLDEQNEPEDSALAGEF